MKLSQSLRLGLRLKFTLLVSVLLLAVFSLQAVILFTRNLDLARKNLENEVKTYANLSTYPLGASYNQYYAQNHFRFGEIVQSTIKGANETILQMKIYDTEGNLLFDSDELSIDERENVTYTTRQPIQENVTQGFQEQLQSIEPSYSYSEMNGKELTSIIYPFLDNYNQHPLSIQYFVSYEKVYNNLLTALFDRIIFSVLSLIVSSVLIIFFVDRFMLKPISELAKYVARVEKGDLNHPIKSQTNDEISDLAINVNSMAQTLLKNQQTLRLDRDTLAAERNKLQVVLSGISDAVIAVDMNRRIITFNRAAEQLIGFTFEQVYLRNINEVLQVFNEDNNVSELVYCPIPTSGVEGTVFNKQAVKIKTAKNQFYSNISSAQIKEGMKINLGCILTLHDVTKERQLEDMKIDFVSMAAHELRTPLTALKGYIFVYLRKYRQMLNDEQTTFITRMNIATQRLVGLVENLLDVAKIERKALSLHMEPVDWFHLIEGVLGELRDQATDKQQTIQLVTPVEPLPKAAADKFRISEVLNNLIANAITYTPRGGAIKVWTEVKDNELITHVQDTGEGIPKEALPNLFTKFFRVQGRLEQGSKGTGLGLYIAKSIITMHNGRIWAESTVGKGSTFSFTLPIATTNPPAKLDGPA